VVCTVDFARISRKKQSPIVLGALTTKGILFWGECRLYACATEHKVENCGLCTDLPCELFVGHFEGASDSVEGQKDALYRVGLLTYLRKFGTEKCLEMIKRIGE